MEFKPLEYDAELATVLKSLPPLEEMVSLINPGPESVPSTIDHQEFDCPGPDGNTLGVSVMRKKGSKREGVVRPGIYHIHGGGMITGTRWATLAWPYLAIERFDVVVVTIEYRLAPANPDPALIEDCYAGVKWMWEHVADLGIDPAKIVIQGISAGGGLAAGLSLLLRDRPISGFQPIGQILLTPMLDDRSDTLSAHQFNKPGGIWSRDDNIGGWTAYLGDRRGTDKVSIYAAPARAVDLSGLPAVYIDVASTETFRDEVVQYAHTLWKSGTSCELHVWPGGFHGFEGMAPKAKLSIMANEAKLAWYQRLIDEPEL